MNPVPFNQNFRRYSQDTCDLMIEDKKSPFPTWMNFNKPNPLKFSLGLTDPDRPEQSPIRITGDRSKLESLHQAVESYVGELLAKAPLPQLNEAQSIIPGIGIKDSTIRGAEPAASVDRPIDALNVTGDQPHLEADGLSRHFLYLGNLATDNQAMVSLTTLQLFDLTSTLAEGLVPVENSSTVTSEVTAMGATADLHQVVANPSLESDQTTVEIVQPEVVPAVTDRFANNVAEPRVVKSVPPGNEDSAEFSNIRPSTIHQKTGSRFASDDTKDSIRGRDQERFQLPKVGLGNSGADNFPDFSASSPFSSIWPWLGVGTAAAGIVALSLFGGKDGNLFAGKPTAKPTVVAKASTAVGEYQPLPVPLPSGIESSPSFTPSLSPTPSKSTSVVIPGSTTLGSPGFSSTTGAKTPDLSKITRGNSITPNTLPGNSQKGSTAAKLGLSNAGNSTDFARDNSRSSTKKRPDSRIPRGEPVGSGNTGFAVGSPTPGSEIATSREVSGGKPGKAKRPSSPPDIDDSLPGSVPVTGDDLLAPSNSKTSGLPVEQLPADSSNPLEAPDNDAADSLQATETQSHFQKRWKADPNFSETLQYVIRVDKNGKVVRVTPQGDISKNYLDKTSFLRPGEKLVSPSRTGKDQDVRVLLKPNGEVEAIAEP
jgi:Domain of unknown function (DUF4335)